LMQTAFKEASSQTVAHEAVLVINEIQAKAQCNQCAMEFEPEIDDFLCPECRIADVRILAGDKIILKAVSCPTE